MYVDGWKVRDPNGYRMEHHACWLGRGMLAVGALARGLVGGRKAAL